VKKAREARFEFSYRYYKGIMEQWNIGIMEKRPEHWNAGKMGECKKYWNNGVE
jgi:hypothetical protein